jgi:peptide methionine sulfoxide reductase MsrB
MALRTLSGWNTVGRNRKVVKTRRMAQSAHAPTVFGINQEGTETPFTSPLNNEKRKGTFVCVACALPLFESRTKFDSGTGWPSFFDPTYRALEYD